MTYLKSTDKRFTLLGALSILLILILLFNSVGVQLSFASNKRSVGDTIVVLLDNAARCKLVWDGAKWTFLKVAGLSAAGIVAVLYAVAIVGGAALLVGMATQDVVSYVKTVGNCYYYPKNNVTHCPYSTPEPTNPLETY